MIRKVLIANRGEIVYRIAATCRALRIATVAVYSDADARALHIELTDEAVYIGGAAAADSYLNIDTILDAAKRSGADAVHPGYGFLSENPDFAQAVIDAGLTWIGPKPETIRALGSKIDAKRIARAAGVPVLPGYDSDDQTDAAFVSAANEIGYPVMVKAAAGGGGKGMRFVSNGGDLAEALVSARREAQQAFGDPTLLLEKALERPRHVEIQIFGDIYGNVIALGERDCSIQRRHQKIIEESPSPALDADLRTRMSAAAVSIGNAVGYVSAGTVEFIVDTDKNFYFLEVNTRLQVEHRVTEAVARIDLVEWQIAAAEGKPLPSFEGNQFGHALEVRVYAEDPTNDFLPATGEILHWKLPEGSGIGSSRPHRIDSAVRAGDLVSIYYDPMLAKVVGRGATRDEAIRVVDYALATLQLLGVRSNIDFLRRTINHPDFIAGEADTEFVARHPDLRREPDSIPAFALIAAALHKFPVGMSYWRNSPYRPQQALFKQGVTTHTVELNRQRDSHDTFLATIGNQTFVVKDHGADESGDRRISVDGYIRRAAVASNGDNTWVWTPEGTYQFTWIDPLPAGQPARGADHSLRSPMPGKVAAVHVNVGQTVAIGDVLVVIEAMKMEHRIRAPYVGIVSMIFFAVGQIVEQGAVLLELEA